ncbi:MAG: hypothetical protein ACK5DJ_04975 [Bacteroidota bacterium]|jgi:hypothetical protein
MKTTFKTLALLMASIVLISSCSKDDDSTSGGGGGTPATNTSKLCNKNWKIETFVFNGVDITSQLDACELDNFTRFSTDGNYVSDEGPTKCDPADPQTTPGTWSWAANETKLVTDGDTTNLLVNSGSVLKIGFDDGTINYEVTFGL